MTTLARFRKQRTWNRSAWKPRFTKKRVIQRGSTNTATMPLPTLTTIAPTTALATAAAFVVTCTGTNFISGITKATVNDIQQQTTFVSATSVTFVANTPSAVGSYTVNVINGSKVSTTPKTLTLT